MRNSEGLGEQSDDMTAIISIRFERACSYVTRMDSCIYRKGIIK
jgi:hypothetical protein